MKVGRVSQVVMNATAAARCRQPRPAGFCGHRQALNGNELACLFAAIPLFADQRQQAHMVLLKDPIGHN
jgi:hypothetical protein